MTFPAGTRAGGGSGAGREAGAAPGEAQGGARCVISLRAGENSHFRCQHRAGVFSASASVLSRRRSRSHLSLGWQMGTGQRRGPGCSGWLILALSTATVCLLCLSRRYQSPGSAGAVSPCLQRGSQRSPGCLCALYFCLLIQGGVGGSDTPPALLPSPRSRRGWNS